MALNVCKIKCLSYVVDVQFFSEVGNLPVILQFFLTVIYRKLPVTLREL